MEAAEVAGDADPAAVVEAAEAVEDKYVLFSSHKCNTLYKNWSLFYCFYRRKKKASPFKTNSNR